MEKVPLDQSIGPAVVIDCRSFRDKAEPGMSPIIPKEFFQDWQEENGAFQPDDIVLLQTGWTTDFYRPFPEGLKFGSDVVIEKKAPGWPAPDGEAMEYLADLGLKTIGADSGSMGPLQADAEPHWAGLGKGMVFIERLVNLELLPQRGSFFVFLPIKLEGGSGAPGRAIAFSPK